MEFSVLTHTLFIWRKSRWTKRISMEQKKKQSSYLKLMQKCNFSMSGFGSHVFSVVSGETVLCLLAFSDKSSGLMCHSVKHRIGFFRWVRFDQIMNFAAVKFGYLLKQLIVSASSAHSWLCVFLLVQQKWSHKKTDFVVAIVACEEWETVQKINKY